MFASSFAKWTDACSETQENLLDCVYPDDTTSSGYFARYQHTSPFIKLVKLVICGYFILDKFLERYHLRCFVVKLSVQYTFCIVIFNSFILAIVFL